MNNSSMQAWNDGLPAHYKDNIFLQYPQEPLVILKNSFQAPY